MTDEPQRHRGFMTALVLVALGTTPFPFLFVESRLLAGLPAWLWWSMAMTVALAGLTAWGVARYWKDDDGD